MPAGSYVLEKKAFTYQVNLSFDGTNWTPGPSLPVEQIITVKYQSTAGTNAVTNWVGVPGHSVFGGTVTRQNLLSTLDNAWAAKSTGTQYILSATRTAYKIPMGTAVGTAGENYIVIFVDNGNQVVTAFPVTAAYTPR